MAEGLMKKKCKDCGAEYKGTKGSRFCAGCKAIRSRAGRERRQQEMKEALGFKKKVEEKRAKGRKVVICSTAQCRKCLYVLQLSETEICCGHLYYTGKMRPSEPPPDCKAFEKMDRKKRAELLRNVQLPPAPVPAKNKGEREMGDYTSERIAATERWSRHHRREG